MEVAQFYKLRDGIEQYLTKANALRLSDYAANTDKIALGEELKKIWRTEIKKLNVYLYSQPLVKELKDNYLKEGKECLIRYCDFIEHELGALLKSLEKNFQLKEFHISLFKYPTADAVSGKIKFGAFQGTPGHLETALRGIAILITHEKIPIGLVEIGLWLRRLVADCIQQVRDECEKLLQVSTPTSESNLDFSKPTHRFVLFHDLGIINHLRDNYHFKTQAQEITLLLKLMGLDPSHRASVKRFLSTFQNKSHPKSPLNESNRNQVELLLMQLGISRKSKK